MASSSIFHLAPWWSRIYFKSTHYVLFPRLIYCAVRDMCIKSQSIQVVFWALTTTRHGEWVVGNPIRSQKQTTHKGAPAMDLHCLRTMNNILRYWLIITISTYDTSTWHKQWNKPPCFNQSLFKMCFPRLVKWIGGVPTFQKYYRVVYKKSDDFAKRQPGRAGRSFSQPGTIFLARPCTCTYTSLGLFAAMLY